jgi:hypothetical protein
MAKHSRVMRENLGSASIAFALRVVEPTFELPLQIVRHDAAKLLPARVNNVTLTSVSRNGAMLTHAQLEIVPGDKRLLSLSLPANANFWFAFVNRNGVWPWREQSRILIPLEQQSRGSQPIPVEIFYTSPAGAPGLKALDLQLLAPKFDLPLENITWRVSLADKWDVKRWTGAFQFQGNSAAQVAAGDVRVYLENEQAAQAQRSKEAEQMLAFANNACREATPAGQACFPASLRIVDS